jgi:hypothetical protein
MVAAPPLRASFKALTVEMVRPELVMPTARSPAASSEALTLCWLGSL